MKLRALISILVAASASLALAACGESAPSTPTVVGDWVHILNNAQFDGSRAFTADGTFTIRTVVTQPTTSASGPGCATRTTVSGRYQLDGSTLIQSETSGTRGTEGCTNPSENVATAPLGPTEAATFNRRLRVILEPGSLRLIDDNMSVDRYYRQ